jgi:hypothetical protein
LGTGRPRLSKSLNASIERLVAAGLVRESGYRNFISVKPPEADAPLTKLRESSPAILSEFEELAAGKSVA